MLEIVGKSQNYDWGTLGKTSKVAFLSSRNNVKKDGDDELPFAELWMGTVLYRLNYSIHPDQAPSR